MQARAMHLAALRPLALLALAACGLAGPGAPHGLAAETVDPARTSTTSVILKVDAAKPVPVRATSEADPPTITIEFPERQVASSLPERSVIARGVLRSIAAGYSRVGGRDGGVQRDHPHPRPRHRPGQRGAEVPLTARDDRDLPAQVEPFVNGHDASVSRSARGRVG